MVINGTIVWADTLKSAPVWIDAIDCTSSVAVGGKKNNLALRWNLRIGGVPNGKQQKTQKNDFLHFASPTYGNFFGEFRGDETPNDCRWRSTVI
jgi:hypothetical protein